MSRQQCTSTTIWVGEQYRCTLPQGTHENHKGGGLGWAVNGDYPGRPTTRVRRSRAVRSMRERAVRRFAGRVVQRVHQSTGIRCDVWVRRGGYVLLVPMGEQLDYAKVDAVVSHRHRCRWVAGPLGRNAAVEALGLHRVFGLPGAAWPHIGGAS